MVAKKNALKKIVANMTMGNDMGPLFTEVVNCVSTGSMEVKKMVYLYLIHYARHKPDLANIAVQNLILVYFSVIYLPEKNAQMAPRTQNIKTR